MSRMNIFECVVKICQAIMTENITKVLNNNRLFRKKEVKDVFLTIAKNEKYKNI